jgi:ribosomal protein S18 acetylase RimI-like enzyme
MIRYITLKDDLYKVAQLIYESDKKVFGKLFGAKDKALDRIKSLILLENNTFSYKHILCYDDNGIKGILVSYNFQEIDYKLEEADYLKAFSMLRAIRMGMVYDVYGKLFSRFDSGYYIECFCVEEPFRGKGIGSKLMQSLFKSIGEKHKKIYLDVSVLNTKAVKLYKRMGFDVVGRKMLTPDLSTYVMLKKIN